MFAFIKNLFHKHTLIYTSRVFIGNGTKYSNAGGYIDIDHTNIYITKGYCLTCGKQFTSRQEIINIFDQPQPYDKE